MAAEVPPVVPQLPMNPKKKRRKKKKPKHLPEEVDSSVTTVMVITKERN